MVHCLYCDNLFLLDEKYRLKMSLGTNFRRSPLFDFFARKSFKSWCRVAVRYASVQVIAAYPTGNGILSVVQWTDAHE
jgi:hypothetical protein